MTKLTPPRFTLKSVEPMHDASQVKYLAILHASRDGIEICARVEVTFTHGNQFRHRKMEDIEEQAKEKALEYMTYLLLPSEH